MARLTFIPDQDLQHYVEWCWRSNNNQDLNSTTLANPGSQVCLDLSSFNLLNTSILSILPSFIGFCIYAVIFGLSLAASGLVLLYLFKEWRNTPSHLIVVGFTLLIASYNVALFGMKAVAMVAVFQSSVCPGVTVDLGFMLDPGYSFLFGLNGNPRPYDALSLSVVPIFLWITDAFLLYRAWIIWVNLRQYMITPVLAFLAALCCGIIWLVQASNGTVDFDIGPVIFTGVANEVSKDLYRWVPALGFSCALDALTTGMIAGRLIYHHRKRKRLTESQTTFYAPIATIFIESAALSLISKIIQLAIPGRGLSDNPIVVPLCTISSNLIVLRKALGADVGEMLARKPQDLSAPRFRSPRRLDGRQGSDTLDASIPGGFGAHLIQTIGGHTVDIRRFDDDNSEQSSLSNVPKM